MYTILHITAMWVEHATVLCADNRWDTGKRGIMEERNSGINFNCRTLNFANTARAIDIQ